jgi:hypothetical protein
MCTTPFGLPLDDYGRLSWVYQTQVRHWAYRSHSMPEWRYFAAKDSLDLCLASEGTVNTAWGSHDPTAGHGLECHHEVSLLSERICPDGRHLLSWNTALHGPQERWPVFMAIEGKGDALILPRTHPSKTRLDYVGLSKLIVQISFPICKNSIAICFSSVH